MTPEQAQNLLNVARALRESTTPESFTMSDYLSPNTQPGAKEWCGTPACALGHYAVRGDLQNFLKPGLTRWGDPMLKYTAASKEAHYFAYYDDESVMDHFGLESIDEAEELFGPVEGCGGAKTPIEAAEYIENFVKRKMKA